jgi:hypothetical protein
LLRRNDGRSAGRTRGANGHRSDRQSARSSMEHPPVPGRSWHPVISKPVLDPPSGPPVSVRQNVYTGAAREHRARNRYQPPELLCTGHNFLAGADRRTSLLAVSWSLLGWGPFRHPQGHLSVWSEPCLDLNDVSLLDMGWTPGSPRRRGNEKAHCGLADEHVKRRIGQVGRGRLSLASKASLCCIASALSRTKTSPFDCPCMPLDNTSILVLG